MINANSIRNLSYLPIKLIKKSLSLSKISESDANETFKENLINHYNNKLLYHLKYQQWHDFFYFYNSCKVFNHGANIATHIIAAHGYIMAYKNIEKANSILNTLPETEAVKLTKNIILCYEELNKLDIAPNSPDWAVIVSMCAVAALGRKRSLNKWEVLQDNQRTSWHYNLRPWKYPRHIVEVKEEFRFKQRGDK